MKQKEDKKKEAALLIQFNKLGSRYNMAFTHNEVLPQRVIGLDSIMQKMLTLETEGESIDWYLINLKEVQSCSLKTILRSGADHVLNFGDRNELIDTVAIEFSFKNGLHTVVLPFYEANKNTISELPALYNKACNWEMRLNKMVMAEGKRA